MKTETLVVTPALAAFWLEKHNTENRRVRKGRVEYLAGMISRGEWVLTHQGIAFCPKMILRDGQHRLMAVVKTGIPVQMLVTFDMPPGASQGIDQQLPRDYMDLKNTPYKHAAVARWCAVQHFGTRSVSPAQVETFYNIIRDDLADLMRASGANTRGFANAQVRAAAIVRMLDGHDADYVLTVYADFVRAKVKDLPPIAIQLVEQIYSGLIKSGFPGEEDLFCRALKIFDQKSAHVTRLTMQNKATYLQYARVVLARHVKDEKKPAPKDRPPVQGSDQLSLSMPKAARSNIGGRAEN